MAQFSERQLAVASTWADLFEVEGRRRSAFIRHYLHFTTSNSFWCVALGDPEAPVRPILARLGDRLQYFDGRVIRAGRIDKKDAVRFIPVHAPEPSEALALVDRLVDGQWWRESAPLLTSFCKAAREFAMTMCRRGLGSLGTARDIEPRGRYLRYFNVRQRYYLRQIGATLRTFNSHLDRELLFTVRSVRCPAAPLYNWLATGDRVRRLQAVKAQPILLPMLVLNRHDWFHRGHHWKNPQAPQSPWPLLNVDAFIVPGPGIVYVESDRMMGAVVDEGLPLNAVMAWLLRAPESSIRFLGKVSPYHAGSALTLIDPEYLLAAATLGNRRPARKADWKSVYAFLRAIPWPVDKRRLNLSHLLSGGPSGWDDPAWPRIANRLADLQELFNLISHGERAHEMLLSYIESSTCRQLGRLVDEFHRVQEEICVRVEREQAELMGALVASDERTHWPALLPGGTVHCPNGLQVVELVCPADLVVEHDALGHCIDHYDYPAYQGVCRLVSVRRDGVSLASAELALRTLSSERPKKGWTPRHLTVVQLRARHNDPVPAGSPAHTAFTWFMKQIRSGAIATDLVWPDMTVSMKRYADTQGLYRRRLVDWIEQRLADSTPTVPAGRE